MMANIIRVKYLINVKLIIFVKNKREGYGIKHYENGNVYEG